MSLNYQKYLKILSYFLISQFTFSIEANILENNKQKIIGPEMTTLTHDFTEADKKMKEASEYSKQLYNEGKIDGTVSGLLFPFSGEKALAKTGVVFDFKTEEDTANSSTLSNKHLKILNGTIEATSIPWNTKGEYGKAVIENSEITLTKNRSYPYYSYFSTDNKILLNYYETSPNYLDIVHNSQEKDKYLSSKNKVFFPLFVGNSYLYLKDSKIKIQDENYQYGSSNNFINEHLAMNPKDSSKDFHPAKAGLHIIRTSPKLASGEYDLELSDNLRMNFSIDDSFSFSYFDKNSVKKWYEHRFHPTKGTPFFLLGKNAKLKAKNLFINNSDVLSYLYIANMTDLISPYFNKDIRMIVFEKDSEADLETIAMQNGNLKFEDAIVHLKNINNEPVLVSSYSVITGKGVFDINGQSILREAIGTGDRINKNLFFTDLEFLPTSKIDLSFIQDAHRDYFLTDTGIESIKDDALKSGEFKLTFDENTNTYFGYSQRRMNQKIQEEGSNESKGIGLVHASDADMYFKQNSDLHLYREKYATTLLNKNGSWKEENDEKGNLISFTGITNFNDTTIHFRSNLKEELSDSLIITNYPVIGTGATLAISNQGDSTLTGTEKIVLIQANKGTSSQTKFHLNSGKINLGGFDYHLYERLTEKGKEYYLAHGIKEGVLPDKITPKELHSMINNIADFAIVPSTTDGENIINKKIKTAENEKEYSMIWNGNTEFENSQFAILGKNPAISNNSKISLKNSSLMSKQGLALSGSNGKELLSVDKDSSLILENSSGGAALAIKDAAVNFNDTKTAILNGSYSIYSNGGNIKGEGLFKIDGNIYHKGEGGINLTLTEGSILNSSILDVTGDVRSSKLHFKKGSEMYINGYSNMNLSFDTGSKLHLYSLNETNTDLTIMNHGNKVIFTEPIHFENTDIYFRTNMDEEEADKLEILGTLSGTSANLHLMNHAEQDMPLGGKKVELVYVKSPKDFTWNLANQIEVGGYFYNTILVQESKGPNKDIISIKVGDFGERKSTLSSTSKGMISNTISDYTTYNSFQDSIFDTLYSNNYNHERKNSIWAKMIGNSFETKDYGMKNEVSTILVGMDKALNSNEGLYGGFFAGNIHNNKKLNDFSGKGSFNGFTGGLYLSYRGYLGFGDSFVTYTAGKTKYDVLDTARSTVNNEQDSKYIGAGVRFGRRFFLDGKDTIYFEPSAKITYGRLDAQNSKASNGLKTKVDAIKSWTTGAHAKVGYQNTFSYGNINSYAKVGVTQEILGKYNVRLNENGVEEIKLDGNTIDYGIGMEYTIGNNSISLDLDMKNSPVLKNYYKVSLGYQYKF